MLHRTLLTTATCLLLSAPAHAQSADRPVGDTRIHADVRDVAPFPEGIAVKGGLVYVSGPATFLTVGMPASKVGVYDLQTGALVRTLTIQGQDLTREHALSCIAFDGPGRLYVIDTQQGVLRLDLETGTQQVYAAPLPTLPGGSFPLPNDLAFDAAGWLYITDSFQGAIWRVPPGGGAPRLWFHAPEVATGPFRFGVNGVRLSPGRDELWFTHTEQEALYALPLVEQPQAADLRLVHRFAPGSGPDGLTFGQSGRVYVALASSHQVAVLTPGASGFSETRLGGTEPWDAPANIAFANDGSLRVANHATQSRRADHFLILDVFVGDRELPLAQPWVP